MHLHTAGRWVLWDEHMGQEGRRGHAVIPRPTDRPFEGKGGEARGHWEGAQKQMQTWCGTRWGCPQSEPLAGFMFTEVSYLQSLPAPSPLLSH